MNKLKIIINLIVFIFFINFSFAAERIFYEDCEDRNFSQYFLEKHYGSAYGAFWQELLTEISQSTVFPHGGEYCMTYDPFATKNPHSNVGLGDVQYGNTSNFDLSSYHNRYWYFKWYQRWEKGIEWNNDCENKLIYINWHKRADFLFKLQKYRSGKLNVLIRDSKDALVYCRGLTHSGGNLDDMEWHKIEVYIDAGTTGDKNGCFWVNIDDLELIHQTGVTFNSIIHSNPIHCLTGWPSNISGGCSGPGQTWLDDLEIWTGLPAETPEETPEESIKFEIIWNNTTENGGTATFTAKLDSPGSDETEDILSSSSITFGTTDWNQNKTVTVGGVDDHTADGDQMFNFNIVFSSDDNNNIEDIQVVNIDNDSPGFSIGPISRNTTENGGKAAFTMKLNSKPMDSMTIALKCQWTIKLTQ